MEFRRFLFLVVCGIHFGLCFGAGDADDCPATLCPSPPFSHCGEGSPL